MDTAKVDGLARVLAPLAEHRQVVVCTHDTRLPQALKYLRLPATVLTVDRRERSAVRVRSGDHPVKQALYDAKALARTPDLPGTSSSGSCPACAAPHWRPLSSNRPGAGSSARACRMPRSSSASRRPTSSPNWPFSPSPGRLTGWARP
ncbi:MULTISPECIES: hypothetical protein [unclassified Streptomyces]|uniref:hypothetical protein n=1 Tax=unclassified Streptomyces TaxID=2593676 RepID=UPI0015C60CFF|nr:MULTISPECIES: hypothetical protein [unclassified Streptomyces]